MILRIQQIQYSRFRSPISAVAIELLPLRLKIAVQPFDPVLCGFLCCVLHHLGPNTSALIPPMDRGIEDKPVRFSIPGNIDKSNQERSIECADIREAALQNPAELAFFVMLPRAEEEFV